MDKKFQLTINIGNADVLNPRDISRLLRWTANRVEKQPDYGKIMDLNGNSVGSYELMDTQEIF